jgi:peptidoglycan/LPS O-acetylase OafA/YrhL
MLAVAVMCYHLGGWLYDVRLKAVGSYSVCLFFVLSGFAMTWVYSERSRTEFPLRSFYVARAARIVPLWWLAVLGTVVFSAGSFRDWNKLIENLTFMSAFSPTRDIPLGGWSIEIEVIFYLLFPVLLTMIPGPRSLVLAFAAALMMRLIYVDSTWPDGKELPFGPVYSNMPNFLVFFVGGMIAARARMTFEVIRRTSTAMIGVVIVVAILSTSGIPFRQIQTGLLGGLLTIAAVVAVTLVSYGPNPRTLALRRFFAFLGAVSYGTYLLHPLVYRLINRLGLPTPITFVTVVACTLAVAWATYRWFERPIAAWVRRRVELPPTKPAAPSAA